MRRFLFAFALLGGLAGAGAVDVAVAQDCIQDQYGRIICGQRVQPYYQPRPRYYEPEPYFQPRHYRGGATFGGGFDDDDRRYAPPNRRAGTGNGCPRGYTVQDGLCKPYTGR